MHLVIVRSGGSIINFSSYNCQELGLAKALSKKGWKVSIVLAGHTYREERIEIMGGKEVTVYSMTFKALNQQLAQFEGMERLLEKLHPDLIQIHEFGMWMSFTVTRWAQKHQVKTCLIQGSYRPTQKPIFKQLELLFNATFGRYVLNRVQGIGYKSPQAEKYIRQYTGKKCLPTYIGLDEERFYHTESKEWKRMPETENKHLLLYVGTLESRRNPLFLLDVMERLPDNYLLMIAGDGILKEKLKRDIQEKDLEQKCVILGKLRQEELPALYKASDLFLLASDYEIYGMVILEAMYFGTPVISTLTAGAEVLITSGEDGVIIPNKKADTWSHVISELCNDTIKLTAMSSRASKKITDELVWDKASERFIELYNNITEMKKEGLPPPLIFINNAISSGIDCCQFPTQKTAA